jgi:hypothetical protein
MNAALRPALGHAFRRAALPLGWYYAVTLALPLANGATQAGATFVGHAVIVLVVPPILIVLVYAVRVVIRNSFQAAGTGPADRFCSDAGLRSSASKRQPPGGSIGAVIRPRIEGNRRAWGSLANSVDDSFK